MNVWTDIALGNLLRERGPLEDVQPLSRKPHVSVKKAAELRAKDMKWCPACQKPVPLDNFRKIVTQARGLVPQSMCRDCQLERNRVEHTKRRDKAARKAAA